MLFNEYCKLRCRMVDHAKIDDYFNKHCREDVKRVECYSFSPHLFT